jgi:hypothetical protein
MTMDILQTVHIIEVLERFLEERRPPEEIREKVDLGYRIQGQSVFIYEIRPSWSDPKKIMEIDIAKATFVLSKNHWKIFWKRADLKWHSYSPVPTAKSIADFVDVVTQDNYGCFWG